MAKTAAKHHTVVAATTMTATAQASVKQNGSATAQDSTSSRWTAEEIKRLLELVPSGKPKDTTWAVIATYFPNRTPKQCREKLSSYQQSLKKRKTGSWSVGEDAILTSLQQELGNKWTEIASHLHGRTENDVKNRWWSKERSRKRATSKTPESQNNSTGSGNGLTRKKSTRTRKTRSTTASTTQTPMKSPAADSANLNLLDSAGFLGTNLEFEMPPLPNVAPPQLSSKEYPSSCLSIKSLETDAVSCLVTLKTTPLNTNFNCDLSMGSSNTLVQLGVRKSGDTSTSAPWTTNADDKENTVPIASTNATTARWTYPPPREEDIKAALQATGAAQKHGQRVEAHAIFSPSYSYGGATGNQLNGFTPSSAIPLDTLPLCDSILSIKYTPMQNDQNARQVVTMSIKASPLVAKAKIVPDNAFTPLPFADTPIGFEPHLFAQAAGILQGDESKSIDESNVTVITGEGVKLPRHSPLESSSQILQDSDSKSVDKEKFTLARGLDRKMPKHSPLESSPQGKKTK